jgi:hypothetical protein
MDGNKLDEMSIDSLWELRLQVNSELGRRITIRKAALDDYLQQLGLDGRPRKTALLPQ